MTQMMDTCGKGWIGCPVEFTTQGDDLLRPAALKAVTKMVEQLLREGKKVRTDEKIRYISEDTGTVFTFTIEEIQQAMGSRAASAPDAQKNS